MRWLTFLLALAGAAHLPADEPKNAAMPWDSQTFHKEAKPLPAGAVTSDWPRFLGPQDQPVSPETKLSKKLPASGPPLVWEVKKGSGYASPAIAGEKVLLFHRVENKETLDCLDSANGRRFWTRGYDITYKDRYGYSDGPRASPVIDGSRVYTYGVASRLSCVDLASGALVWEKDCAKEYGVPQYFFGTGATPLVQGDLLIVDMGGTDRTAVVAFDKATGAQKWVVKNDWNASYAAPIPATLQGKKRVLVFDGGEGESGKDSTGGLLSIDPATGTLDDTFFWRATRYTSVNAASPVLAGPNRVFVTQAYVDRGSPCNGGAMVELGGDMKFKTLWKNETLGCHFMTPVFHDGHLYAFSGEKEYACDLVCHEAATGKQLWKNRDSWDVTLPGGRKVSAGFKRGSLLRVDGAFLCLGEWGTLAWLDLSPTGMKKLASCDLFLSEHTWTLPAVSHGLLYVCQHQKDEITGAMPRLLCYDLRGE